MSSYVKLYDEGCKFKRLDKLRRFLDLEPPYDDCRSCERSLHQSYLSKCKKEVQPLLDSIVESEIPSRKLESCLRKLSNVVVCKRRQCQKDRAQQNVYKEWCDRLWENYVLAHHLNPEDVGSRPTEFTKEDWEKVLEEEEEGEDSSSSEEDSSSSDSSSGVADDSGYGSINDDSFSDPNCDPAADSTDGDEDDDADDADDDDDSTGGDNADRLEGDEDKDPDKDTGAEDLGLKSLAISNKLKARPETRPLFSEYFKTQLSHTAHRNQLLELMMKNIDSDKNRCPGYIYCYKRSDCPGYVKIGYTRDEAKEGKDEPQTTTAVNSASDSPRRISEKMKKKPRTVETRMDEWRKSCEHKIELVFSARIECHAVQRIESLIHTTLRAYRRKQDPPCEPCRKRSKDGKGGQHDEWFEVDEDKAREVVNFWTRFAQLQPYHLGGLTAFWQEDISNQRNAKEFFPKDYPVKSWMGTMDRLIEQLAMLKSPDRWKL